MFLLRDINVISWITNILPSDFRTRQQPGPSSRIGNVPDITRMVLRACINNIYSWTVRPDKAYFQKSLNREKLISCSWKKKVQHKFLNTFRITNQNVEVIYHSDEK